jgi:hypothetical protein
VYNKKSFTHQILRLIQRRENGKGSSWFKKESNKKERNKEEREQKGSRNKIARDKKGCKQNYISGP